MKFSGHILLLLLSTVLVLSGTSLSVDKSNDYILFAEETGDTRLQVSDNNNDSDVLPNHLFSTPLNNLFLSAHRSQRPDIFYPGSLRPDARAPPYTPKRPGV